jgi:hypothetical protein
VPECCSLQLSAVDQTQVASADRDQNGTGRWSIGEFPGVSAAITGYRERTHPPAGLGSSPYLACAFSPHGCPISHADNRRLIHDGDKQSGFRGFSEEVVYRNDASLRVYRFLLVVPSNHISIRRKREIRLSVKVLIFQNCFEFRA